MKRLRLSIVALLTLMGVVTWLLPSLVLFSAADPKIVMEDVDNVDRANIEDFVKTANADVKENVFKIKKAEALLTGDEDKHKELNFLSLNVDPTTNLLTLTFKSSSYKPLKQETKEDVMNWLLNDCNNSNMSFTNRTRIYNFIAESDSSVSSLVRQLSDDVNADFYAGYKWFKPWSGPIGTLLGVISLGIFVLLSLTIVCDLAYMTIPLWQVFANDHFAEKGKKPRTVSLEAFKAVQAVENDNEGRKEVVSVYFSQKSKQMVAISICLLYLVSGQIYTLIANIVDYFQGIVNH